MNFERFTDVIPSWLSGQGPESGMVISSRARLARNIGGIVYAHRASDDDLAEVVTQVLAASRILKCDSDSLYRNDELDDMHRNILIERHLISPLLASRGGNRERTAPRRRPPATTSRLPRPRWKGGWRRPIGPLRRSPLSYRRTFRGGQVLRKGRWRNASVR